MKRQRGFFDEGVAHLKPLTMNQVAEVVGVHETTVSRAIANKYVQTPYGLFDLKYFFTPGYQTATGEVMSNTSVKDAISGSDRARKHDQAALRPGDRQDPRASAASRSRAARWRSIAPSWACCRRICAGACSHLFFRSSASKFRAVW